MSTSGHHTRWGDGRQWRDLALVIVHKKKNAGKTNAFKILMWRARHESNVRSSAPEADALSTGPRAQRNLTRRKALYCQEFCLFIHPAYKQTLWGIEPTADSASNRPCGKFGLNSGLCSACCNDDLKWRFWQSSIYQVWGGLACPSLYLTCKQMADNACARFPGHCWPHSYFVASGTGRERDPLIRPTPVRSVWQSLAFYFF